MIDQRDDLRHAGRDDLRQEPGHEPRHDERAAGGLLRPLLWVLLVAGAVVNVLTSAIGLPLWAGIGSGLVTLACVVGLVADYRRRRR